MGYYANGAQAGRHPSPSAAARVDTDPPAIRQRFEEGPVHTAAPVWGAHTAAPVRSPHSSAGASATTVEVRPFEQPLVERM